MDQLERFRGCLLGLAAGDAVGAAVEFRRPGTFEPLTDMIGGGPFGLLPGQWTDDTSMALCLATSLLECEGFDPLDQMERYCRWQESGYLSSNGICFDIGRTVANALNQYRKTGNPVAGSTDQLSSGNGSLMRLAPVPMFFFPDIELAERFCADSSRTTHGAEECVDACRLFGRMICRALDGQSKEEVLFADAGSFTGAEKIIAIAKGEFRSKKANRILGSGYVVSSLEAALWSFNHTDCLRDAILRAANLGDDADTTAAICGQLAGAYYGASQLPVSWRERLALANEIVSIADQLHGATASA